MVIICQNINQSKRWKSGFKYQDNLTTNDNCYKKLLCENPDIIILTEVTYPQNIEKALAGFSCYYNSDKYMQWNRQDKSTGKKVKDDILCNKILIAINNNYFAESISDVKVVEDRYMISTHHIDYLKISFKFSDEFYNIIGLRFPPTLPNGIYNGILESILKENIGVKTIIAGDFNTGRIREETPRNYENYKFNIHTLNRICFSKFHYREPQYKLVTVPSLNVKSGHPIDFNNYDESNEWTCKVGNAPPRPIDHFIVSSKINDCEYQLIKDPDGVDSIDKNDWGAPNHRIIKLTIKD